MQRTAARLLLLAVLAGAGTACRRQPTHARVDAAIAPLIPGDTTSLAGLRLDRLQKTPFYRDWVATGRLPQLAALRERTGLDPTKDIWELVWAQTPRASLLFIRGKFGGEFGLEPRFDAPGLARRSYKGYYILERQGEGVLFFNTGVAVAGRVEHLQAVVDNRDKPSELPPQELLSLVETLPPDHFWVVSHGAPALAGGAAAGNLARLGAGVGQLKAHADLSEGLALEVRAEYPDTAQARQAQDTLRAFVSLARLRSTPQQDALRALCDGTQATAEGTTLRLQLRLEASRIEWALNNLPAAGRRR